MTVSLSSPPGSFAGDENEAVYRRLSFLSRVSEILASSLDYDATLRRVVWLAVPELADWCAVYLLDADGCVESLAVAHADPAHAALAQALESSDQPRRGETPGVLKVLRDGRPVLLPRVGEAELAWLGRGRTHLQLLRSIGLRSVIGVPLRARGRQVGVLALATAASGRTYTDADLPLAEELASRCGMAVDHARLYRETQDALQRKEESLALLHTLLRGAPDGLGFLDRELRWVRLNEALAAALGEPVKRLAGRSMAEGADGCSSAVEPLLRRVLATGEPLVDRELGPESPLAPCRPDRHHLMSAYPVRNPQGEILGLGLVVVDITARKQSENELRQSEERYRRLVETANEGVWLVDTEMQTTFVNQRMAGMLGYAPAEIAGRSFLEFVVCPDKARQRIGRNLAGFSEDVEVPFRHRDGSIVLALGGTSPVTDGRGQIIGALGMFSDITARKRAEAERDRLLTRERAARDQAEAAQRQLGLLARASDLLASSLDYEATLRQIAWLAVPELADWCAVYLVEPDGSARLGALASANPGHAGPAREAFERARPLSPARLSHVLQTGRAEVVPSISEVGREAAQDEAALQLLRSMGLRSWMQLPMRARGRTLGVLTLGTLESGRRYGPADVTLAQHLADRCAVGLDNAVLVGELRRALGVREELLAATSHELRTPLAHIKGFTSTLRQPDVEWDEVTRQDFLAEIEREADRLNVLIGDLLNMSRLESGAPEQHPRVAVAPAALVSGGLDRVRGVLREARVEVEVAPDLPSVVVDAAQLEQVVANLVENAAKYGPPDIQIRVVAARVGDELELAVEDDGPGIPEENLERVFDKFFRARSTEQSGVPGTGLGLAICRAIVEAHGGRIWAESRSTRGARLVVRLPLGTVTERGAR